MKSALGLLVLVLAGCAHNPSQLRPGAYNLFDQNTHDLLLTTQATLEAAAKDVAPLPVGHPLKVTYNALIDAYNAAQKGYKAYHAALEAHQAGDQAGVQSLLQGLDTAIKAYAAAKAKPVAMVLQWAA